MPAASGVQLGIRTPAQVTDDMEKARTAADAAQYQQKPEMDLLASHVLAAYDANKTFRAEEMDTILLQDLRQMNGEYDPEKLAELKRDSQPVVFFNKTGEKASGAKSWISDVMNFDEGKPFTLKPTPLPDLSPLDEQQIFDQAQADVDAFLAAGQNLSEGAIFKYAAELRDNAEKQRHAKAKERALRMELTIFDQMVEGGWYEAFEGFLHDLTWSPVAIIKGPVLRRVWVQEYAQGPFGMYPRLTSRVKPTFQHVSPFDFYPSRNATTPHEGEMCERVKISPADLESMKSVPGYNDDAIDKILAGYADGGYRESTNTDPERARLEHKGTDIGDSRNLIEGVEYWGSVSGKLLKEKGVKKDNDGNPLADLRQYESNVIVLGNYVIYAALNPERTGKRPYAVTSWRKKPGSFYGTSIPRLMREVQQVVNACIRSLCFNMAQASGFQTVYNDMARVVPGEDIRASFPGKVHQFLNQSHTSEKPIDFFQPDTRAGELLNVFKTLSPEIDDITGIPRYAYGNDQVAGAGRTATGLGMLMTNAAKGIKMVLANIDRDIFRAVVNALFHFNMKYNPDESIKGDVIIVCSGALSQIVNEQNSQRIMQLLTTAANPMDAVIIGPEQRAAAYRELAKDLPLAKDALVKTDDEIRKEREAEAQAMAEQAQMEQGLPQGAGRPQNNTVQVREQAG